MLHLKKGKEMVTITKLAYLVSDKRASYTVNI